MQFLSLASSVGITSSIALLIAVYWQGLAYLTSLDTAIFLPLAFQCLGGVVALVLFLLVFEKRPPHLSIKSLQASFTVCALLYLLGGVAYFLALRSIPAPLVAFGNATTPIWLLLLGFGVGKRRFVSLGLALTGLVSVAVGAGVHETLPYVYLAFAVGCTVFAFYLSKKLFWLHSSTDLNIWAFIIAFSILFGAGVAFEEWSRLFEYSRHSPHFPHLWGARYILILLTVGFFGTGLAAYLYRFLALRKDANRMKMLAYLVPLFILILNHLKTLGAGPPVLPWGVPTFFGMALLFAGLYWGALEQPVSTWLCHFLTNSRRQGDRVLCNLKGFATGPKETTCKLEVFDLSIGGLGVSLDTFFAVNDKVVVSVPVGTGGWTQVSLDCRVIHITKNANKDFPWTAGLYFQKMDVDVLQVFVEFLANLGKLEHL